MKRMTRLFLGPVKQFRLAAIGLIVCLLAGSAVGGGTFTCEAPLILSREFEISDSAVFARFVETYDRVGDKNAFTVYEIVEVLRDPRKSLRVGSRVEVSGWVNRKPGNFMLLLERYGTGVRSATPKWNRQEDMTRQALRYLREAPVPNADKPERLDYFAKFLEHPDPIIAKDAYQEFAEGPQEHVIRVARKFSPAKLRKWVFEAKGGYAEMRRGLYGMMLGVCGDKSDIPRLEAIVRENPEDELRLGIDGMISGYLLLTGADGLKFVEKAKLLASNVPFSETHSTLNALRFMWTYGEGRIPAERLQESLRLLLDQPDLAELAIMDLARWRDWKIQPRLLKLYNSGGQYSEVRTKRAIIRFMLTSTYDLQNAGTGSASEEQLPPHVLRGREALRVIRKQDAKLVADAEKHFLPKGRKLQKAVN